MSHYHLRAGASASAVHDTHPGEGPPGIGPQRLPTDDADFAGAVPAPSGYPPAGRSALADAARPAGERTAQPNVKASSTVRLAKTVNGRDGSQAPSASTTHPPAASEQRSPLRPDRAQTVRSWPLLVLALPAAVAVWSGWVGIGQMTGFGQIHPLPGIWDSLHVDTAVTLPVGVEAYAAYALRAWLSASAAVSARTRRFARWSAISSLVLGMAGQVAYHLLTQAGARHAPWGITTAVSCLPVLVLGMGAALAHLLRADLGNQAQFPPPCQVDRNRTRRDHTGATIRPGRLAEAQATAAVLSTAGKRISRRTLRTAGVHGSNADLGVLARILSSRPGDGITPGDAAI